MNSGDKLVLVKRLGKIVVGAQSEAPDLVFDAREPRKDQDRSGNLCRA